MLSSQDAEIGDLTLEAVLGFAGSFSDVQDTVEPELWLQSVARLKEVAVSRITGLAKQNDAEACNGVESATRLITALHTLSGGRESLDSVYVGLATKVAELLTMFQQKFRPDLPEKDAIEFVSQASECALSVQSFMQQVQARAAQDGMTGLIESADDGLRRINDVAKGVVEQMCAGVIKSLEMICQGAEKASWRDGLTKDSPWDEYVKKAQHLTDGDFGTRLHGLYKTGEDVTCLATRQLRVVVLHW